MQELDSYKHGCSYCALVFVGVLAGPEQRNLGALPTTDLSVKRGITCRVTLRQGRVSAPFGRQPRALGWFSIPARSGASSFVGSGGCRRRASRSLGASAYQLRAQLAPAAGEEPSEAGSAGTLEASPHESIINTEVSSVLARSYLEYALSVIHARALPDARDGLKPVHRRILYAMNQLRLDPDGPYRKCARVVGEVLGKYHPHGDSAVYDALVRMAQPFSMLEPLVDGQGNLGSVDGDKAAAMRYTECRLTSLSKRVLLADIDQDTVDMVPNFDASDQEPVVLPARLPQLLLNGASGIAVGMATNIPPHNLRELVSALIALIKNPKLLEAELEALIPAPDFPTGGIIMGLRGSRDLHRTGQGAIILRARTSFETVRAKNRPVREAIIVHELPYQVNKAQLLERMATLVNEKKLDGIADLRDESDRDGMRIVIELKRDADKNVVLNQLFKKTALQAAFNGNMLALVGRRPEKLSLRRALEVFLEYRVQVIQRRCTFELNKARDREHIVQGLRLALRDIDAVIRIVRNARDVSFARRALVDPDGAFGLSERQADAILGMQLRRLTQLEMGRLDQEHQELLAQIAELENTLARRELVMAMITRELQEIQSQFGRPRRSAISPEEPELSDIDLVPNEESVIIATKQGYVKRMAMREFEAQRRGTRGKAAARIREDDQVAHFFSCRDHDTILAISQRGTAYAIRAFQIPQASRVARGAPLSALLPVFDASIGNAETSLAALVPISAFTPDRYLLLLTQQGWLKKTPLSAFANMNARGLIVMNVRDTDTVRWVRLCGNDDSVIISSTTGLAVRFSLSEAQLRSTGRRTQGVRSMRLRKNDAIADMDVVDGCADVTTSERYLVAITEQGYGKRLHVDAFRIQRRGGGGKRATSFKMDTEDRLLCLRCVEPDSEIILITERGTVVRVPCDSIPIQGRWATGVYVQRLDTGDRIAQVSFTNGSEAEPMPSPAWDLDSRG
ncbi:DNA gyrase subunit A precursor [Cyanidioschyzon merolae strain 10D]|uniref:DNA topoisomerase (ATP-hydrolyzing) n=1 Tax=Cyanidioschyzon merolae (strain NIES-3377 / 10D) TaxID=280699 RepID=M1UWZ2_CYAM1|nr:DNA gyrase subunit A precursor [Cyanidioschyzon merolae strain 10D]BAM82846.1 DNA gyrase subunit A precursor [Cyanidioschyzon merolae strain 10D]|eukprot:XP_005538882.1 DNA gyrase subunit A precursor [Cyanidioschyzon merolae strain 10D]